FQAEDGIRDFHVTGVQTCALPILITFTVQRDNYDIFTAIVCQALAFETNSTSLQIRQEIVVVICIYHYISDGFILLFIKHRVGATKASSSAFSPLPLEFLGL